MDAVSPIRMNHLRSGFGRKHQFKPALDDPRCLASFQRGAGQQPDRAYCRRYDERIGDQEENHRRLQEIDRLLAQHRRLHWPNRVMQQLYGVAVSVRVKRRKTMQTVANGWLSK